MMDVAIVFSALNAALLVVLLYVFAGIAIRSRASHSVGLMFFALLLLANSLLTAYSYADHGALLREGGAPLPFDDRPSSSSSGWRCSSRSRSDRVSWT